MPFQTTQARHPSKTQAIVLGGLTCLWLLCGSALEPAKPAAATTPLAEADKCFGTNLSAMDPHLPGAIAQRHPVAEAYARGMADDYGRAVARLDSSPVAATPGARTERLDLLLKWGTALASLKRMDEASAKFREAEGMFPTTESVPIAWSNALLLAEKPAEARDVAKAAAKRFPHQAQLQVQIGRAEEALQRRSAAETHYLRAIELDRMLSDAHAAMGELRLRQQRPKDALPYFRKATDVNIRNCRAYLMWGVALMRLNNSRDALAKFEEADRLLRRKSPTVNEAMADAHQANGSLAEAERLREEARRLRRPEGLPY